MVNPRTHVSGISTPDRVLQQCQQLKSAIEMQGNSTCMMCFSSQPLHLTSSLGVLQSEPPVSLLAIGRQELCWHRASCFTSS